MENHENLEPIGELKLVQPEYLFTINDVVLYSPTFWRQWLAQLFLIN